MNKLNSVANLVLRILVNSNAHHIESFEFGNGLSNDDVVDACDYIISKPTKIISTLFRSGDHVRQYKKQIGVSISSIYIDRVKVFLDSGGYEKFDDFKDYEKYKQYLESKKSNTQSITFNAPVTNSSVNAQQIQDLDLRNSSESSFLQDNNFKNQVTAHPKIPNTASHPNGSSVGEWRKLIALCRKYIWQLVAGIVIILGGAFLKKLFGL